MKRYDIIILGAGPSGLFCAVNLADSKQKVCVIEKNKNAGKKLLITGSGRCNLTNNTPAENFIKHFHGKEIFVKPSIYKFSNTDLIKFFEKNNIKTIEINDGKIFPESENSHDILNILLKKSNSPNINFHYNTKAVKIIKDNDQYNVQTSNGTFISKKLVISTGGNSYISTGSSGDGYNFAKQLGHNIIPPKPALAPIYINDFKFKNNAGISFENRTINLYRNNKKINKFHGDILFTHKGLSGPGILNNSIYCQKDDIITINLVNHNSLETLQLDFINKLQQNPKKNIKNVLLKYHLPEKFLITILNLLKIPIDTMTSHLTRDQRKALVKNLFELSFTIDSVGDYNIAMVTKGGVDTKEINNRTMESKITPGLYFIGEILDVDGETGGYNLQFAFSSAYAAASNLLTPP